MSCVKNGCSLGRLPFIGMDTQKPTLDDLMNRVVVSHQWMGDRFKEALEELDDEAQEVLLQMSRSLGRW